MSHLHLPLVLLLTASAFAMAGCTETIDDFTSEYVCRDYCDKKSACDGTTPSADETDTCVSDCRDTIENNCGNEHQAAVNDTIADCVDLSCDEFWACMVFDAAPECLDFI